MMSDSASTRTPEQPHGENDPVIELTAIDVAELDFEEEEPTHVVFRPDAGAEARVDTTMLPPPSSDGGDVFLLTKRNARFKAGAGDAPRESIDMAQVLAAPSMLPPEDGSDDLVLKVSALASPKACSVAPVAMPLSQPKNDVGAVASRRGYAIALGLLAAAAAAVALWRPARAAPPAAAAAEIATPAAAAVAETANRGAVHEVALVEVVGAVAPRAEQPPPAPAGLAGPVPAPGAAMRAALGAVAASPAAAVANVPATAAEPARAESSEPAALPPAPPPPEPELKPFDRDAANAALNAAAAAASRCREDGAPSGTARVSVTFAPSGRATTAIVDGPPYGGTKTGGCIATAFRSARVSPFAGEHVTVRKSVALD